MHLSFDSIAELSDFLEFCGRCERIDRLPTQVTINTPTASAVEQAAERGVLAAMQQPAQVVDADVEIAQPAEEQPKRRRRTKAESEAEKAALAPLYEEGGPLPPVMTDAEVAASNIPPGPEVIANPFAAPSQVGSENIQAILSAPNSVSRAAAAAKATGPGSEPVPEEPAAATPAEVAVGDTFAMLQAAAALIDGSNAIEHMTKCREFISTHGMQKYGEGFALVGLDSNVMGYSPADRSLHLASLQYLASA